MILNRTDSPINREGRKKINDNWETLERTYKKVVDDSSEAKTTAIEAKGIAQGIDGKATEALNTANQANTKSDNAVNIATQKGDEAISIVTAKGNEAVNIAKQKGDESISIATQKGNEAIDIANQANNTSNYVQHQLDTVILESGDANPEVAQARADFVNLRERLDTEFDQVTTQLTQTNEQVAKTFVYLKDFGAVSGGVIDASQALQDACDFVGNNGGGTVYVEDDAVYLINNNVVVTYDNVHIVGKNLKTSILLIGDASQMLFWKKQDEVIPFTNPVAKMWNNLPPFANLKYFDATEAGGTDNRLNNAGISNLTLRKKGAYSQCLTVHKCDNSFVENILVTYENPALSPTTSNGNAILFHYCNNLYVNNVEVQDNFHLTFGVFCYWSFNVKMSNVKVGNVTQKGIELKHVVQFSGDNLQVIVSYPTTMGQKVIGVAVGYGSSLVKLNNLYLKNCSLTVVNSTEYNYTSDVEVSNVVLDDVYIGLELWHLKNATFKNIQINLQNKYTDVYAILHTIQPLHKFADIDTNHANYAQNSERYNFDGDYDLASYFDYLDVKHYRYYEYQQTASLLNVKFDNITIEFKKTTNTANCNARVLGVQGFTPTLTYTELIDITNGKFKTRDGNLMCYWDAVKFDKIKVNLIGDGNADTKIQNQFLHAPFLSLKDCNFNDVYFDAFNPTTSASNANITDLVDSVFLNVAKIINTEFSNIRTLPFAQYGSFYSVVRAFDNLRFYNFTTRVGNITGTYNPTFIKFIEIRSGLENANTELTNEDYKGFVFESCELKGFRNILNFTKLKTDISNTQLTAPRIINVDIDNTAYNETNYVFIADNAYSAVNQPLLKSLNVVNNIAVT